MNLPSFAFPSFALGLVLLSAGPTRADETVTYEEHVLPILRSSCLKCHDADRARGGLDLSGYDAAMKGSSSGEVLVAGDPDSSRLFGAVTHELEPNMPPGGERLPDPEIEVIRRWIADGLVEKEGGRRQAVKATGIVPVLPMHGATGGGAPAGPPPMPERLSLEPVVVAERAPAQTSIAASRHAPLVAMRGSRQVLLYHAETFELLGVLPFPEGTPESIRFSRDGALLVIGGGEAGRSGRVAVFDVVTGDRVATLGDSFDAVLAADLRNDRAELAWGGPDRKVVIVSAASGERRHVLERHADWVTAIAYSDDGVLLATGDRSGGLCIWEARSGRLFHALDGHDGAVFAVAWRADSNVLASAGADGTVRVWEMNEGKQQKSLKAHEGGTLAVDFAPDGRFATGGRDHRVAIWDAAANKLGAFETFSDEVGAVAFTAGGARIVAGDWSGDVAVVDAISGSVVARLDANPPSLAARIVEATDRHAEILPRARRAAELQDALRAKLAPIEAKLALAEGRRATLEGVVRERSDRIAEQRETQTRADDESRRADADRIAAEQDLARARAARAEARASREEVGRSRERALRDVVKRRHVSDELAKIALSLRAELEADPEQPTLLAVLESTEVAVGAAEAAIDAARLALAERVREQERAHAALVGADADVARVEHEAEEAVHRAERAGLDRDAAAAEIVALEHELEAITLDLAREWAEASTARAIVARSAGERARLEREREKLGRQLAAAAADLARWEAERINVERHAARRDVAALEAVLAARHSGAGAAAAGVADLDARIAEIDAATASRPERLAAADLGIDTRRAGLSAEEAKESGVRTELDEREATLARTRRTLAGIERRANAEPDNHALRDAVRMTGDVIAVLAADVDAARAELAAAAEATAAARARLDEARRLRDLVADEDHTSARARLVASRAAAEEHQNALDAAASDAAASAAQARAVLVEREERFEEARRKAVALAAAAGRAIETTAATKESVSTLD